MYKKVVDNNFKKYKIHEVVVAGVIMSLFFFFVFMPINEYFYNKTKVLENMYDKNYYKNLLHFKECKASCCSVDTKYLPEDIKKTFNNSSGHSNYSCSKGCVCLKDKGLKYLKKRGTINNCRDEEVNGATQPHTRFVV